MELEQMRKGLFETLEIETFVHLYPKEFYGYLIGSTTFDATPNYILDCFDVRYSDEGSNERILEEAIVMHWTEYITECESKI